ncbi:hypothetical protein [Vaginisenegalia massiliensis]|uniref:hypothetical protein n=1 Tax=Vaginisenegalia massiliensis TaxID=2058294 RepID=UPI000F51F875|nr:hypothetical protein [Vaginisenegalia massiliensis]
MKQEKIYRYLSVVFVPIMMMFVPSSISYAQTTSIQDYSINHNQGIVETEQLNQHSQASEQATTVALPADPPGSFEEPSTSQETSHPEITTNFPVTTSSATSETSSEGKTTTGKDRKPRTKEETVDATRSLAIFNPKGTIIEKTLQLKRYIQFYQQVLQHNGVNNRSSLGNFVTHCLIRESLQMPLLQRGSDLPVDTLVQMFEIWNSVAQILLT